MQFIRTEGIVPAPESSHAIHGAIVQAIQAREEGKEKTILFNLSGHGFFDMSAYSDYLAGNLIDHSLSDVELKKNIDRLEIIK
jgi:tryptophan synthase beta chain